VRFLKPPLPVFKEYSIAFHRHFVSSVLGVFPLPPPSLIGFFFSSRADSLTALMMTSLEILPPHLAVTPPVLYVSSCLDFFFRQSVLFPFFRGFPRAGFWPSFFFPPAQSLALFLLLLSLPFYEIFTEVFEFPFFFRHFFPLSESSFADPIF